MTYTFLHAADLHLDSPLWGLSAYPGAPVDAIRGATRRALENLVQAALDRRVAFVLLAGDVYDGDCQDFNTPLFFCRQMSRLRAAGIPVFLISGNHDAASRMTPLLRLRLPDGVRLFSADEPETVR
ncbi:MAG: metallophosphoesterase, partial [Pirellulales bacterium]